MDEYYGLYGKVSSEAVPQAEADPLKQLSENDISKEIDNELIVDKETEELQW